MKITIFLFCLFNFSIYAQEYFYSNSLAMEFERIIENDLLNLEDIPWVIKSEQSGNERKITLYKDGIENKILINKYNDFGTLSFMTELMDGKTIEETDFKRNGQIEQYRSYDSEGLISERYFYIYNNHNELEKVEITNDLGELISFIEYYIRADGSIRSVYEYNDSELVHSEVWNSYDGSLFMENSSSDSSRDLVFYNNQNQKIKVQQYSGDDVIYEENYEYHGDGTIKSIDKMNYTIPETTSINMNLSGLIIRETLYRNDLLIYTITFDYSNTRLIQKEKYGTGIRGKWIYNYKDDKMISEEYYNQGILEQKKIITDSDNNNYIIELYHNNEAFMNVFYTDNVKTREEFLEKGRIIRVRDLGEL